jgi:hypothetical protein
MSRLPAAQHDAQRVPDLGAEPGVGGIGVVFHAGPLANGPISPARRAVGLDAYPRRLFPASVSRAAVAAAMLDEAEFPRYAGTIAVPLER